MGALRRQMQDLDEVLRDATNDHDIEELLEFAGFISKWGVVATRLIKEKRGQLVGLPRGYRRVSTDSEPYTRLEKI